MRDAGHVPPPEKMPGYCHHDAMQEQLAKGTGLRSKIAVPRGKSVRQGAPNILKFVERACTFLGAVGLCVVGYAYLDAAIGSHSAVAAFEEAAAEHSSREAEALADEIAAPDQSLWSENAKAKYVKAQARDHDTPVALLNIERLSLEVPVFVGTDRVTLNRGAGIIDGTALPGENGNVVISAHRDSYFRSLKDIAVGDAIVLRTLDGPEHFEVVDISITDPLDVSVLDDTESSTLTLITCYPFYYVGFAPERYIVRAIPTTPTSNQTIANATAAGGNDRTNAVDGR